MTADPSLDGYDDVRGPDRRLAESLHLAQELEPGPVRDALLEAVRSAGYGALSDAIAAAQKALAAAREHRFDEALGRFVTAGREAGEALTIPWDGDGPAVERPKRRRPRTLGELRHWCMGDVDKPDEGSAT